MGSALSLALTAPANTGLASRVLDELAEAKGIYFPKLKNIHMSHIENSSGTRVSAENARIVLELDDEEEDDNEEDYDEENDDEEDVGDGLLEGRDHP